MIFGFGYDIKTAVGILLLISMKQGYPLSLFGLKQKTSQFKKKRSDVLALQPVLNR